MEAEAPRSSSPRRDSGGRQKPPRASGRGERGVLDGTHERWRALDAGRSCWTRGEVAMLRQSTEVGTAVQRLKGEGERGPGRRGQQEETVGHDETY
jgi:hypothetical protein